MMNSTGTSSPPKPRPRTRHRMPSIPEINLDKQMAVSNYPSMSRRGPQSAGPSHRPPRDLLGSSSSDDSNRIPPIQEHTDNNITESRSSHGRNGSLDSAKSIVPVTPVRTRRPVRPEMEQQKPPSLKIESNTNPLIKYAASAPVSPVVRLDINRLTSSGPVPDIITPKELCIVNTPVHFQRPLELESETHEAIFPRYRRGRSGSLASNSSSGSGPRRRSSASSDSPSQLNMTLHPTLSAADVIIEVIVHSYGEEAVVRNWGSTDAILKQFGLYEAEFIREEEESMSLDFSRRQSSEKADRSSSKDRRVSIEVVRRRVLRLLDHNETPLLTCHGWKFNVRRFSTLGRRSSEDAEPSKPDRDMHFVVKELADCDKAILFPSEVQETSPILSEEPSSLSTLDILRNQELKYQPADKLHRRLLNVRKEEKRAIDEVRERYIKLRYWLTKCYEQTE